MDVLQFAYIDHISGLYQTAEHLKMGSYIRLISVELEIVCFALELRYFLVYQQSKLVVLQSVHQQLLVSIVTLIIEETDSPQRVEYLTLFIVLRYNHLLFAHVIDQHFEHILSIMTHARIKGTLDNILNQLLVTN